MKLELDMSAKGFRIVFRNGSEESIVTLTGKIVTLQKSTNIIKIDLLAYHTEYSYS
jgi:hypothetical protein